MATLHKDKAILDLLAALDLDRRGWVVVDHWDGDLCAVGIASSSQPDRLAYVSTFNRAAGRYDCECEAPCAERPDHFATVASSESLDFAELLELLQSHLEGTG